MVVVGAQITTTTAISAQKSMTLRRKRTG